MFGVRGNRVNILITSWFISVCYLALNWAAASYTAFRLAERFGIEVNLAVKIVLILAIAGITLAVSVYGHATIVRLYQPLALVLTAVFVVMAVFVLGRADWGYQPAEPLHGTGLWAVVAAGLAIVASAPLSYTNSADFARYLPSNTSPVAVAGWTTLGAFVPSVLTTGLGALAATALNMADPETALEGVLPSWFIPVFLIAVIVGTMANNAMTAYSSGLALQAVGLRLRRSRSVLLDGSIGAAMTMYALLVSNFLDTVSNMMQLVVTVMDPFWHPHTVDGTPYSYAGLTEHGMLGKIGVNSAGLGLFFNILGHRDDAPAGVPVHVLAAAVLGTAGSVGEALDLLRAAPISTSGAFTLLDTATAMCAELSPRGVSVIPPRNGYLPHTNHFLDARNTPFEKPGLYDPDSQDRLRLIESRLESCPIPERAEDLVSYLQSDPGQPQLCCVPAPGAAFGQRWATLATVLLEPEHRRVRILAGTPLEARDGTWHTLHAAEVAAL
ncbi:C45 family autoproteolytic acyltransferase/hydolase [Mycobacterium aquaticum]|uniref:C45 family autoproteolytic acyltransferase/hydolase n=1 Tax=Mycobacterium aquaticum TaxID=1927124 RepID=UPI002481B724|nr:C45 family autoproteolytic acyltransferase/hydolase [Mycobacterium aquaticum]